MTIVRVQKSVVVQNPDPKIVEMVALREGQPFDSEDPIVTTYPWAFESDADRSGDPPVEQATAAPGEKRTTRK